MSRQKSSHKPELVEDGVTDKTSALSTNSTSSGLEEQINRRAFELYDQRGREDGHAEEDWLRAERELLEAAHTGNRPEDNDV